MAASATPPKSGPGQVQGVVAFIVNFTLSRTLSSFLLPAVAQYEAGHRGGGTERSGVEPPW